MFYSNYFSFGDLQILDIVTMTLGDISVTELKPFSEPKFKKIRGVLGLKVEPDPDMQTEIDYKNDYTHRAHISNLTGVLVFAPNEQAGLEQEVHFFPLEGSGKGEVAAALSIIRTVTKPFLMFPLRQRVDLVSALYNGTVEIYIEQTREGAGSTYHQPHFAEGEGWSIQPVPQPY